MANLSHDDTIHGAYFFFVFVIDVFVCLLDVFWMRRHCAGGNLYPSSLVIIYLLIYIRVWPAVWGVLFLQDAYIPICTGWEKERE